MSDVMNVLTRKTSLRKACKELQLADMERLAEMVSELIEERKAEIAAEEAARAEHERKLEEARRLLAELGVAPEELATAMPEQEAKSRKSKGKIPPKYKLVDENGKEHFWTGRGRMPKVFQEYVDRGGNREDLLIR